MSSDELEWELYDVFEAGLFPFPIYDHQTARKIIRYLLFRGVLDEEIADAIEDSTADLHIWLNRSGKNMVGEWVIAWLNEGREEYKKEKKREARERGYSWHDHEAGSEESSHSSDDGSGSDGDDACMATSISNRFTSRDAMRKWAARMQAIDDSNTESPYEEEEYDEQTEVKRGGSLSPPPSPPPLLPDVTNSRERAGTSGDQRSRIPLEMLHMHCSLESPSPSSEVSPRSHLHLSFSDEHFQHTPDSGAFSDLYHTDHMMDTSESNSPAPIAYHTSPSAEPDCYTLVPACTAESHIQMARNGIPSCPSCRCSVVHYSLIPKPTTTTTNTRGSSQPKPTANTSLTTLSRPNGQQASTVKLTTITSAAQTSVPKTSVKLTTITNGQTPVTKEGTLSLLLAADLPMSAMDFHMETLDREGPGYIFIMTDRAQNFLPWSSDHRYKIASSRQPERWLAEFRNHNIDMELVWQVKVRSHLRALREVHLKLLACKLHSDWFKCSLSVVMDTISRVVRKYRI